MGKVKKDVKKEKKVKELKEIEYLLSCVSVECGW